MPPLMKLALVVVLLLVAAPAAAAQSGQMTAAGAFRVTGPPGEQAGFSVAAAGDVNGDGFGDVIVGAPPPTPAGGSGAAYVVFGSADPYSGGSSTTPLSRLGARGFRIANAADGRRVGISVGAAGDVNGDGLGDVLVGAVGGDTAVYVVFGKRDAAPVALDALHDDGYAIEGDRQATLRTGVAAGAGDVNGDGLADQLVSLNQDGDEGAGGAAVVFGRRSAGPVALSDVVGGAGGFRILGPGRVNALAGAALAEAGDMNGDGLADVAVGAPGSRLGRPTGSGSAYVVFGKRDTEPVSLGALRGRGFEIRGARRGDAAGASVGGGRDVNGDGVSDLVVGAPGMDLRGRRDVGAGYVVFGRASGSRVSLARLAGRGFRVVGARRGDGTGSSVALIGDVTGDGRSEVMVEGGARAAMRPSRRDRVGPTYIVRGRGGSRPVSLRRRAAGDSLQPGARRPGSGTGRTSGRAGDVNGDGHPDVILGSSWRRWALVVLLRRRG